MTVTPPPGAVLLAVSGLQGAADQAAVLAALRARDQAAHVDADWPRGLLIVQSDQPPEALRLAVQDAGFIAARLTHLPREVTARGVAGVIMRIIGFGFAGAVTGVLLGALGAMALIALDPACAGSGNSGGCAMGIPVFAIGAGMLGGALGMVLSVIRSIRRR
jgi:hypothetical protein